MEAKYSSDFSRDRFLVQELSMFQLSWWLWSPTAHKVSTGLSCSHLPCESAMCSPYWAEMAAQAHPETISARWMFFFTIIYSDSLATYWQAYFNHGKIIQSKFGFLLSPTKCFQFLKKRIQLRDIFNANLFFFFTVNLHLFFWIFYI